MNLKFSDVVMFATIMTMRDTKKQENQLNATYQECLRKIVDDSESAFHLVTNIVKKASPKYIPKEIISGGRYLPLYAFSLVIKEQARVTSEQRKFLDIYLNAMSIPFSQNAYLDMINGGSEVGDFNQCMRISENNVGDFWVSLFRALYVAGTQKDLQGVVDHVTSIIMRFSILGNPNSTLGEDICREFVDGINHQLHHMDEISLDEIDWFGMVDTADRMEGIRKMYKALIDYSQITKTVSEDELNRMLEEAVFYCLYHMIKEFDSQESIQVQMFNDAIEKVCIYADINPEQFINEIVGYTDTIQYFQTLYSVQPLGDFWKALLKMGTDSEKTDLSVTIINNMVSIFVQIENMLTLKYALSITQNVATDYMAELLQQITDEVNKM